MNRCKLGIDFLFLLSQKHQQLASKYCANLNHHQRQLALLVVGVTFVEVSGEGRLDGLNYSAPQGGPSHLGAHHQSSQAPRIEAQRHTLIYIQALIWETDSALVWSSWVAAALLLLCPKSSQMRSEFATPSCLYNGINGRHQPEGQPICSLNAVSLL